MKQMNLEELGTLVLLLCNSELGVETSVFWFALLSYSAMLHYKELNKLSFSIIL